jgi:hypothetical protein
MVTSASSGIRHSNRRVEKLSGGLTSRGLVMENGLEWLAPALIPFQGSHERRSRLSPVR